MCLIVFAWKIHPEYPFILIANRDEFYSRPTKQAGFWHDHPEVVAGRDLKGGGTWMGISKRGQFAAVTNYRDPKNIRPDARSRGDIPVGFLTGEEAPDGFLKALSKDAGQYNGFNALIGDTENLLHFSNYENKINKITPGIYGLSNALLDTPWPKVTHVKKLFTEVIRSEFSNSDLLNIMTFNEPFPDDVLPQTGVPYEWEKAISAICIRTETYGTCCSTLLKINNTGQAEFVEKTYAIGDKNEAIFSTTFHIHAN